MMGRQSGQLSMIILDLSDPIPNNHLLRKISQVISFDFIYEILEPYYPSNGRLSIDPVSMFKMLLVGYLYGIKSECRLVQEIQLNIAYRWFCGFELADKIPDHSTFSKTRLRKWNESKLFHQVFLGIVRHCIKSLQLPRSKKRRTTSKTDPDSGCINHGKKSGIGYLMEATVDCKHRIITGVDVDPAN